MDLGRPVSRLSEPNEPGVDLDVAVCLGLPGEILGHRIGDQLFPGRSVAVDLKSLIDGPAKPVRREVLEDEPRALACCE